MFWEGSMWKYWLWSSKSLVKTMNRFLSPSRLLFIFGTRLSFILMTLQTHQCSLGLVFIISYKYVVLRRFFAKILVAKLTIIRKCYESIWLGNGSVFLVQDYHSSWWSYRLISVLWACFRDFLHKCCFEKVVCKNIGWKYQNH